MENKKIKLISDSSCDLTFLDGVDFSTAPLTIVAGDNSYIDNKDLDIDNMLSVLKSYNGKSSTACPAVGDWLELFGDADIIYVVAMTSGLSGTYSSACSARDILLENRPDVKIHIFDTLSTGPEQALIVCKIAELIKEKYCFEDIVKTTSEYMGKTGLLFSLESLHNFAQNGRVSKVTATAVGVLGIRVVGTASFEGTLEVLAKCRGEKKAESVLLEQLLLRKYSGGKIFIHHVNNENFAQNIKSTVKTKFPSAEIEIRNTKGLCSYYAEKGGILIGFET